MRMTTFKAVFTMAALGMAGTLSPAIADSVNIGISIGTPAPPPPPPVVVVPSPEIVVVPGAPVYYYGGRYYRHYNGAWFVAARHEGPWGYVAVEWVPQPVLALPGAYDRLPPGHAKQAGPPPWAHGRGHKHDRDED